MNNPALTRALAMKALIRSHRAATELDRRLAPPIVEVLREAGLCRMMLNEDVAGLAVPVPDALGVYEALSYAEASVGWIVWNNAFSCFFGRYLEPPARREVFGDRGAFYGGSSRPTGKAAIDGDGDGYRVSGQWSLVSGCELAEWLMLLCVVEENGAPRMVSPKEPEMRFVFIRRGDFEILDTWHVGGLRGTGSHDILVKGVHVPRTHTLSFVEPSTVAAPHGRVPIICSMAAGYAAQTLGVAQCAVDTVVELAKSKVSPDSGMAIRERPDVLESIVRHGTALEAAREHLHARVEDLWAPVAAGSSASIEAISTVWAASLHAARVGLDAVNAMYSAGGATSLYTDCPLERAHRDIHAMLRHIVVQPFWLWDAGRVKVGGAPMHPLYAV